MGQLVVAHDSPTSRPSWAPHGERAYYLGPSFNHYRCWNVYIVHTGSTRHTDTLDHYPDPLFHFESANPHDPSLPPVEGRPDPQPDGSDLVGRWFREPDLGLCQVVETGPPFQLPPGAGNRAPGLQLAARLHHTLYYSTPAGAVER